MNEPVKKTFDYVAVPDRETRAFLKKKAEHGKAILKRTAQGVWEMGQLLTEVKEKLPHGDFGGWIEYELGLTHQSALNFMRVFDKFQNKNNFNFEAAPTMLYLLTAPSVSNEVRESAVEKITTGEIRSTADVKQHIGAHKPPVIEAEVVSDGAPKQPPSQWVGRGNNPKPVDTEQSRVEQGSTPPPTPAGELNGVPIDEAGRVVPTEEIVNADLPPEPPKAPAKVDESDKTDEEWLGDMDVFKILREMGHEGHDFRRAALSFRTIKAEIKKLKYVAERHVDKAAPDQFSVLIMQIAKVPHPRDWKLCRTCKGTKIFQNSDCDCRGGFRLW